MRRLICAFALVLAGFAPACSPSSSDKTSAEAPASCPGDGARLPVTGLCVTRLTNYIDPARLSGTSLVAVPANCTWVFQETAIGDGSEAIVYRALSCDGKTTSLEYAGGAHSASLSYAGSALGNPQGQEVVRIFVSDPQNPTLVIENLISALPADERAKCEVQPANIQGWPNDAVVVGYNEPAARTLPKDQPNAMCGEFGLDEDQMNFWLLRDGFAYFFALGQDGLDFDPNSFTLFKKGEDGAWGPAG